MFYYFLNVSYPGYGSIFTRIRPEAGLEALKLARILEKTTYKLEAHHRHIQKPLPTAERSPSRKVRSLLEPTNHPSPRYCLRS